MAKPKEDRSVPLYVKECILFNHPHNVDCCWISLAISRLSCSAKSLISDGLESFISPVKLMLITGATDLLLLADVVGVD